MLKTLKFHIIAIACICLIVGVLYQVIGPREPSGAVAPAIGDRYVRVASASWGLNCNPAIAEAKQLRQSTGLPKDENGQVIPEAPLKEMASDNVRDALKRLCDGKAACQLIATSETLGFEPMEGCFKKLAIGYRCFEMDRLKTIETNQGEVVTIDCSVNAASSHAPAPAATQP